MRECWFKAIALTCLFCLLESGFVGSTRHDDCASTSDNLSLLLPYSGPNGFQAGRPPGQSANSARWPSGGSRSSQSSFGGGVKRQRSRFEDDDDEEDDSEDESDEEDDDDEEVGRSAYPARQRPGGYPSRQSWNGGQSANSARWSSGGSRSSQSSFGGGARGSRGFQSLDDEDDDDDDIGEDEGRLPTVRGSEVGGVLRPSPKRPAMRAPRPQQSIGSDWDRRSSPDYGSDWTRRSSPDYGSDWSRSSGGSSEGARPKPKLSPSRGPRLSSGPSSERSGRESSYSSDRDGGASSWSGGRSSEYGSEGRRPILTPRLQRDGPGSERSRSGSFRSDGDDGDGAWSGGRSSEGRGPILTPVLQRDSPLPGRGPILTPVLQRDSPFSGGPRSRSGPSSYQSRTESFNDGRDSRGRSSSYRDEGWESSSRNRSGSQDSYYSSQAMSDSGSQSWGKQTEKQFIPEKKLGRSWIWSDVEQPDWKFENNGRFRSYPAEDSIELDRYWQVFERDDDETMCLADVKLMGKQAVVDFTKMTARIGGGRPRALRREVKRDDWLNNAYFVRLVQLYEPDKMFDFRYNQDFRSWKDDGRVMLRGGLPYKVPVGWKRFAVKVYDRYDDGNEWLKEGENGWVVAYHGTRKESLISILSGGFKLGERQKFEAEVGRGVYCSHDIDVAQYYSPPEMFSGHSIQVVLQMKVRRQDIKKIENGEGIENQYLLIEDPKSLRPYGVLVRELGLDEYVTLMEAIRGPETRPSSMPPLKKEVFEKMWPERARRT